VLDDDFPFNVKQMSDSGFKIMTLLNSTDLTPYDMQVIFSFMPDSMRDDVAVCKEQN
jgi:hypothetical protein